MISKAAKIEKLNISGTEVTKTFREHNGLPQQDFAIETNQGLATVFLQTVIPAPKNANSSLSIASQSDLSLGTSRINYHLQDMLNEIKENHAWNGISQEGDKITTSVNGEALEL